MTTAVEPRSTRDAGARSPSGPHVALVLASIGGFVDAAGFLVLFGLFTAHMSGNTTGLGVALGTSDWTTVLERGFVIPVFVFATAMGVALFDAELRRPHATRNGVMALLLACETVVLIAFMIAALLFGGTAGFEIDSPRYLVVGALAAFAMGLQNAALRRVDGITVHTTFVTGMLTEAAVGFVQWRHAAKVAGTGSADPNEPTVAAAKHEALLASGVWLAYLAGGTTSAVAVSRSNAGVLAIPIVVLVGLAVLLHRAR